MAINWTEVNERRISEKTQEIQLYCIQKKQDMTPRAFDLARLSFDRLLDNISDRTQCANNIIKTIRESMTPQNEYVASCSKEQAATLARAIVYNYIGDDLDLYPVTAEKKLFRAKTRKQKECNIPIEEMTVKDILFITSSLGTGENFTKSTMRAVYNWFHNIGIEPIQARVFSILFMSEEPISLKSLPQWALLSTEYKKAARELTEKGFIRELPRDLYCVTETKIA